MNLEVYTLNAFAKTSTGGNPAGVVLDADNLDETQMLKIAQKVGFSETAFVSTSNIADFKIRFFTPTTEVNLCGHATIATFYLLKLLNKISVRTYTQETKAGILKVTITKEGTIFMEQPLPVFSDKLSVTNIAKSLNIQENQIDTQTPIQIVSTGLRDIIIPIKTLNDLLNLKPNFDLISQISKQYNTIGYHVFTTETRYGSTAHCRNFAPLYDIPEEAATGTSNGALSCYLYKYNLIPQKEKSNLIFEQGYSIYRPSEIFTILKTKIKTISSIQVGGIANNIEKKVIII